MSDALPTATATAVPFVLTPPEVMVAIAPAQSSEAVPLKPETMVAVSQQVDRFVDALATEDIHSDAFKAKLDSAFRLGKEEASIASNLMTGRFMERNFVGIEDSAAYKAVQDLRGHLDKLNPGNEGDLFSKQKILGLIPFGNKLQAYFRKYESAGTQLQKSMNQIYAARDDMQRDEVEIESLRAKLWEAMQKLKAAIEFSTQLDTKLATKVDALKATDPERAKAIEQEVLFYARQNLQDMLTQQAVCVNGYLALDVLKRTAREMQNGCTRVATTGMSALAVAQTVARATGNQIQVMEMLKGVSSTIESLIAESGRQLNTHVEKTAEFSTNPLLGIEKIKEMFDQTYKAMDTMDGFRSKAIDAMGKNNQIMQGEIERARTYMDRVRQQQAREELASDPKLAGPVAL
ncbi:MAG: toxic anion resistance protein [Betaproteobacteria bacterium]